MVQGSDLGQAQLKGQESKAQQPAVTAGEALLFPQQYIVKQRIQKYDRFIF